MLLSKLGREEDALSYYDQVLALKPDDYKSLRNRGVSLSNLGREEEAGPWLEKAALLAPDDVWNMVWLGFHSEKMGNENEAVRCYRRVRHLARSYSAKEILPWVNARLADLCKPVEARANDQPDIATENTTPEDSGREVISQVLAALGPDGGGEFFGKIRETRIKLETFTSPERSIPTEFCSFFSVLRKWNSYTPVLPSAQGDNLGGGYFLFHKGIGIAIDPGFNFVENFCNQGFKVADIDAVLITHAHNDHTVDLESILSLLYKLNKDRREAEKELPEGERGRDKKIDLLVNAGTFMKYSGWLSLRSEETNNFVRSITVMHPGMTYEYEGLQLHATQAKHHEIVSSDYCIGCVIEAPGENGFKIGLTSDTGWVEGGSIAEQFKKHEPDLMVVHLGSVKEKELNYVTASTPEEEAQCYDNYHLGILGVTNMLAEIRPKLAVVSEFGEELREVRCDIASALQNVLGIPCLPGDIGLDIRLSDLKVLCCVNKDFQPADNVIAKPSKPTAPSSPLMYHAKCDADAKYDRAIAGWTTWRRQPIVKKVESS
jgi:hypothetical protein